MIEVKEDFMVSPACDSESTLRTAYFLKPISNSIHQLNLNSSSSSSVFDSKERPFNIRFNGWRYPHTQWIKWFDQLKPKYESVWKKAEIFDAIISTKCRIMKDPNLVYGVVHKWCSETNTFVFPFGEATITLEDVMVLGGYSLFGHPIFTQLEDQEMKEVEQKLVNIETQARIIKSMAPSTTVWMDIFIDKGSEIEHEAFLATWLSIFVFLNRYSLVKSSLFPIAVRLARGNTIALAPAVLASLYNDLSLFKKQIVDFKKCTDKFPLVLDVNVQSPFYLVQVWVWERFKSLQPQPKLIDYGDHVLLRWHKVKPLKIENVRLALDSTIDDFIWRPYVRYPDMCRVYYPNEEIWVPCKKDLVYKQMLSSIICLRVSELVGFEFIEQYLPHRVSMQFGFDQDVPGYVPRFNESQVIAWKNYSRPFSDTSLYFPSRFFEADITTRYAKWWEKSVLDPQGSVKNVVPQKRSVAFGKSCDDGWKNYKGGNIVDEDVPSGSIPKLLKTMSSQNSIEDGFMAEKNVDALLISGEDCKHFLENFEFKDDENECKEARLLGDTICQSETQTESYINLFEVITAELEPRISRLEKVHKKLKMERMERK